MHHHLPPNQMVPSYTPDLMAKSPYFMAPSSCLPSSRLLLTTHLMADGAVLLHSFKLHGCYPSSLSAHTTATLPPSQPALILNAVPELLCYLISSPSYNVLILPVSPCIYLLLVAIFSQGKSTPWHRSHWLLSHMQALHKHSQLGHKSLCGLRAMQTFHLGWQHSYQ